MLFPTDKQRVPVIIRITDVNVSKDDKILNLHIFPSYGDYSVGQSPSVIVNINCKLHVHTIYHYNNNNYNYIIGLDMYTYHQNSVMHACYVGQSNRRYREAGRCYILVNGVPLR